MRDVTKSLKREGKAWLIAAALIFSYLAGSYGVSCWPRFTDWIDLRMEAPR